MSLIDAHCHLADPRFDGTRAEVTARAAACGITAFIQGGVDPEDWQRQLELRQPGWWLTFGPHPWYVASHDEPTCLAALERLPDFLPHAVGLGEIGLDYGPRCDRASYARQRQIFSRALDVAAQWRLPLVLHVVGAHGDALSILKSTRQPWRGIVHGFTASWEIARAYLDLGLSVSVGGALARPGYKHLKRAVPLLPPQRLVVESDAPDMAPAGYDRKRNEPETLWILAARVAELTGRGAPEVLAQSAVNLRATFGLELAT